LETAQLQFETLLGSAEAAEKHVADLFEFAKVTPYETGPIIEASRQLQAFGGSALNNYEMLTLLGAAASAVRAPFEDVAFWTGRAYSAIQSGRPIGEAAARFQELALITPEARNRLEELQEAGASADEVFSVLTENFGRFSGSMEKQANTWQGMVATFTDTVDLLLSTALRPFFELASRGLAQLNAFLDQDSVTQKIEEMADA